MIAGARALLSKHPDKKSWRSPDGACLRRWRSAGKLAGYSPGKALISRNAARPSL